MNDRLNQNPGPGNTEQHPRDEKLARALRDLDLTREQYNALLEELKTRRRRLEGGGDSLFDDIYEED
jgi:hypothetical protein